MSIPFVYAMFLLVLCSLFFSAMALSGRFESAGPGRCGATSPASTSSGADGFLYRITLNSCVNDTNAVIDTVKSVLDTAAGRNKAVILAIGQGINLPPAWLEQCETYFMQDGRFAGDICVPWDVNYQTLLQTFLNALGATVGSHSALAGVYFTTPVMTNGFEWHFRVSYDDFVAKTTYPGDTAFLNTLITLYGFFNTAFPAKRVVWEAGHTQFLKNSGAKSEWNTAEPVYDYAVLNNGADRIGLAAWNCAERSFAVGGEAHELQNLFIKAGNANVPLGCQTIGNFVNTPCRFTNTGISLDYGPMETGTTTCQTGFDVSTTNQIACSNTLNWFRGVSTFSSASGNSLPLKGTWLESWSNDLAWNNPTCNTAINLFENVTIIATTTPVMTTTPASAERQKASLFVLLIAMAILTIL